MRILFLSYYYLPHVGGATWSTYNLSRILAERNEVRLLVPNIRHPMVVAEAQIEDLENKNRASVSRTPSFRVPHFLGPFLSLPYLFLTGFKAGKKYDLILVQYHPHHLLFPLGILLGRIFRIPVVSRADDVYRDMGEKYLGFPQKLERILVRSINTLNESQIRFADRFLVACREQQRILESRLGRLERVEVNVNGFDPSALQVPQKSEARKDLRLDQDENVLLFVGRFSGKEYHTEVLLKAFSKLQESNKDTRLLLVGDTLPKSLRNSITKAVTVVGPVTPNEIRLYLSAADICIGPLGPTLTIPLKVLEYLACGKPVVAGVRSVSADIAIDGFNYLCVPPTPEALAATIQKLLTDTELRELLAANAKKSSSNFTWDKTATDLERLLIQTVVEYTSGTRQGPVRPD